MSTLPVDAYLDLVRRSGLVEPERLENVLVQLARQGHRPHSGEELSELLAGVGVVTAWQNRMLMKGLWRGFFLGRYKLLRELGAGGMSSVYLAEHVLLRRRVAIKVLHQKRASNQSHLTRFYRESQSAAALDHPNIVRVHDFDTDGKFHYLVMEFVEGPNLQELVDARGRLDYLTAAEQIAQAADGLQYAHEQGLIHRDVKPANLLVAPQNVVKVTDFGLAQIRNGDGPSLTVDDGSVLGTVDYLAPEQALDSHAIDSAADVYGLGCTMYFVLTGQPPYPTGTMAVRLVKHQTEPAPVLRDVRYDCPEVVSQLCLQMMAKHAAERPSAERVSQTLRGWLASRNGRPHQGPSVLDVATARPVSDPHRDTVLARTPTGTVIEEKPYIPPPTTGPGDASRVVIGRTSAGGPSQSEFRVTTPAVASSAAQTPSPGATEPPSGHVPAAAAAPTTGGDANAARPGESCVVSHSAATNHPAKEPSRVSAGPPATTADAPRKPVKIAVRCRHCGALLHAPATAAGKRAKCPECATIVAVPANLSAVAADAVHREPRSGSVPAPTAGDASAASSAPAAR